MAKHGRAWHSMAKHNGRLLQTWKHYTVSSNGSVTAPGGSQPQLCNTNASQQIMCGFV